MITESQEKRLASLPEGKKIEIKPFDPHAHKVANEIVTQIKESLPDSDVHFTGSTALGIAGQNDIDILISYDLSGYDDYFSILEKLFGSPSRIGTSLKNKSVKWEFEREGFDVEIYMALRGSPALQEQIKTFEILSQNKTLCGEYEQTKLPCGLVDSREYFRKKYEFFNKVLGLDKV